MVARSDAEAEDIAQESLIRAIRGLPNWRSQAGGIEAWLWRIVQNTARDFGRSARRRQILLERVSMLLHPDSHSWPDLDEQVEAWDLICAVRALPSHYRTLIALRFGADLDYVAIGKAVGLSTLAARAATRRAVAALKRQLQGIE